MKALSRRAGLAFAVLAAVAAAPSRDFSADLAARRTRVMERLGPDSMLILWSAPEQRYSLDVDYDYRQDSNLYYLTGLAQADSILVLMPGNQSRREVLFIKDRNPAQEHWTGRLLSVDEAKERTGIDVVLSTSQFEPFVTAMLSRRGSGPVDGQQAARFFDALAAGKGKLGLLLDENRGINDPLTPPLEFARRIRDRFLGFQTIDVTKILADLRTIKTPYERTLLVKSLDISVEAQKAGMHAAHPGAWEYEVKAAIEAIHRGRGAQSWAYPSIVGSGPNTTILHYPEGDRQMQAGELLLADAACSLDYMAGDITRTYPVNGAFSPAQKDLYQIVLQAQEEGAAYARAGVSLRDIHRKTADVMRAGLVKLGLLTDATGEQYRIWYTHGASHYVGVDVHDVGDGAVPLKPGMVFTIEPGVYIRQSALDALPRTAENLAFIEKVGPAVRKYENIGIRIEDTFLLDETGLHNLSAALPKSIDDIEAFMRSAR